MTVEDLRQQLSKAIAPLSQHEAELISESETQIFDYPTPFLKKYRIYTIVNESGYKPISRHLGFAPPASLYWLPASPQNFIAMAKDDEVSIATEQIALVYALAYREVTRSWSQIVYTISSTQDVRFRSHLQGEMLEHQQTFERQYQIVITSPQVQTIANQYRVTLYAIVNQSLEFHRLLVSQDGKIEARKAILEQNLPLAMLL